MSAQERDRMKLLDKVEHGTLTRAEAARVLKVTERQVYRMLRRHRELGDVALVHGLRGKPSNRAKPSHVRSQVLEYAGTLYDDYGPTLLVETLAALHGLEIGVETVRQWLLDSGDRERVRRRRKHRLRRVRRSAIGELLQIDGSQHHWFGPQHAPCWLLVTVDDASGRLYARFVTAESIDEVLRVLIDYASRYGLPRAVYTDKGSAYIGSGRTLTDVGRALAALGIECITAHSPQAKGRVERANGTLQDRLVKELRRRQITSPAEGDRFLLAGYLDAYNARFMVREELPDVHRSIEGLDLKNIFCREVTRVVANDFTISYYGDCIQIFNSPTPMPSPRARVTVRRWLDGTTHVFWRSYELRSGPFVAGPRRARQVPVPRADHPWKQKRLGKMRRPAPKNVMDAATRP
jgi:transposase